MFFDKKEQQVKEMMRQHLGRIRECLDLFEKTIGIYLDGNVEEADVSSYNVHKKEHEADECRREILAKLSEGAFLPFFREDFIGIVELVDKIANRAKTVTQTMVVELPKVPDGMRADIRALTRKVVETLEPLMGIFNQASIAMDGTPKLLEAISACEQEADSIEFKLIRRVFREATLETADKIILSNFVRTISEVADAIENVGDLIQILISKQAI
ncbi:MAG: TIGR00153 family protein [bacterium]|nr:TIGR00153 family protein [bacterium]